MLFGFKAALLQRELSQRGLGRLSGVPENRISSIINGWVNPTSDERRRLATALHKSEDELFDTNASIEIRSTP